MSKRLAFAFAFELLTKQTGVWASVGIGTGVGVGGFLSFILNFPILIFSVIYI
jgi:hypothetical protein